MRTFVMVWSRENDYKIEVIGIVCTPIRQEIHLLLDSIPT